MKIQERLEKKSCSAVSSAVVICSVVLCVVLCALLYQVQSIAASYSFVSRCS